ncbi:unnamed protein product, partial [Phaeothamnion confervicola]
MIRAMLAWANVRGAGPGFINLGNTCFLNATLQCMCYVPPLAQLLMRGGFGQAPPSAVQGEYRRADMLTFLEQLVRQVHAGARGGGAPINPKNVVKNIHVLGKQFRKIGRQEDAHEFLRHLVDHMAESCLRRAGVKGGAPHRLGETTAIHRVFGGYLRSQVRCGQCGFCSDTYDLSMDLSLEIAGGIGSLQAALSRFTATETLDAANRWRCGGCRKMVRAHKQLTVFRAPNVLVIHFKRFAFGRGSGKIGRAVQFPEEFLLDVSGPERRVLYRLTGVVVHVGGSMTFGHYYGFVRAPTGTWHHMDDSSTRQVGLQTVLQQPAYLLFYTRLLPAAPAAAAARREGAVAAAAVASGNAAPAVAAA